MLQLKKISASPGGVPVLQGLNLSLSPGDKLHLSGVSGSGKSTLLRAMLFFEPFTGQIFFDNAAVEESAVPEYRSRIAFLGQQIPPYAGTSEQVLYLPFQYAANREKTPDRKSASSLLRKFRLEEDILKRPFAALSGGQKQRLMLVQVLLLERPLLLLDEPTTGLDPAGRKRISRHICSLKGVTVIAVSHDPEWAEAAGRCLQLSGGRLKKGRCLQ